MANVFYIMAEVPHNSLTGTSVILFSIFYIKCHTWSNNTYLRLSFKKKETFANKIKTFFDIKVAKE